MISPKKILFIGLGGAGQRHLRIFRDILPAETELIAYRRTSTTPLLRPDFTVDGSRSLEAAYGVKVLDTLPKAFAERPDLAVISTPTACHLEPMLMAAEAGCGVFVEKPWAQNLTGFGKFRTQIEAKNLSFQISFQRRFHPLIARARKTLASGLIGRPVAANFIVFSDVRAWHPYEDWRNLYAVRADLGGGVLLTEIHEIDLAYWFFGLPQAVFCSGGNRSGVPLEVEDTVQISLLYPGLCVGITLCFMHTKPSRSFHIAGSEGHIAWDAKDNRLLLSSRASGAEESSDPGYPNDAMFIAQAQQFLCHWTTGDTESALNAAAASLAIVEAAKRSIVSGTPQTVDGSSISHHKP